MHKDRLLIINEALDRMCNETVSLHLVILFSYFLGGTEENYRKMCQGCRSACWKSDYWRPKK